jgi:NAD(P)-dependent dehydrogenase (short-subunit alcohol dehydrogenase family)
MLVLGGNGFLGRAVTARFRSASPDGSVVPLDIAGTEIVVDLRDEKKLSEAFDHALAGQIFDSVTLVNCLSSTVFTDTALRTSAEVEEVLMANVGVTISSINAVAKACAFLECGGEIVNVSSIFAKNSPRFEIYTDVSRRSSEVYGASKAGVEQLTRYYAKLLGPRNIRVNCVAPGGIYDENLHSPSFVKKYGESVALGRMVFLEEVVETIMFLASPASSGITGAVIDVNCGYGL